MPRDLLADRKTLDGMPQLSRETKEPEPISPPEQEASPLPPTLYVEERFKKMKEIHPFVQLLNSDDLDDCDWLEHAAFDAIEAATREKVRLLMRMSSALQYYSYHDWAAVRRQDPPPCSLSSIICSTH
jgi:hypothetical protein